MIRKYIITVFAGLLCSFAIIFTCVTVADVAYTKARATEKETETTEHTYKVVETESVTEAVTEPFETIAETELETESATESSTTSYYNVNLPEYVQDVIFVECKSKGIAPSVVIAMIERESRFNTYAMGDDGRSFGLMQIQPKWHLQRMINLGCTDLFQPYQNVVVGIDYLAELNNRYGDIEKALTAYNRGSYDGTITSYAIEVVARANELERGY